MRIFITGGTGLIGSELTGTLLKLGHAVTVLTRNRAKGEQKFGKQVTICTSLASLTSFNRYDAVVNLAGEPIIGKRWTSKRKEYLCKSRWDITRQLTELIKASETPPHVFISGSAIGYYGAQEDNIVTENANPNDEFTHRLCKEWEGIAMEAQSEKTNVCILRTGIVLSGQGGMLSLMKIPFRMGLGATLGNGRQYISWIHIQDMAEAIIFLLNEPQAQGAFNMTAPYAVTNKAFSDMLAKAMHRPRIFRIPAFVVKLLMGEAATMVLDGQRAIPQRLLDLRYNFSYNRLDKAFEDIFNDREQGQK